MAPRRGLAAALGAALVICARGFCRPRPHLRHRCAPRRSDLTDGTDDDDDEPEAVIGLETLPEALQAQIIDAIARSRARGPRVVSGARAAAAAMGVDPDGPALFVVGDDDDDAAAAAADDAAAALRGDDDDDDDDEAAFVVNVGPPRAPPRRKKKAPKDEPKSEALERIARFDLRPREVREHLDRYVVRQEDAKKVLSVAVCDHYNVVRRCLADPLEKEAEYSKPNILVLGPSGSGKTYILRTLAKLLGVPFVKADATKFTETGIVGEDAEDLVRSLVEQADGDVALAQYGIIYVDEIDKLCRGEQGGTSGTTATSGGAAGARGVQNTFLKVMEETDVSVNKQSGMIPQIFLGGESPQPQRISTKHVLFIFSGAFTGLDARLKAKHAPKALGFGVEAAGGDGDAEDEPRPGDPPRSFLKQATSADFVDAGLETEFIGRIPVRVAVDPLGARDLELILLQSEGSVLRQYERDFRGYGVDLTVSRDAIAAVAERAAEEKTGARGLVTVLERTFREFKYELPCAGVSELNCDAATVADPRAALDKLLAAARNETRVAVRRADCRRVEAAFGRRHAPLTVALAPAAEDFLVAECAYAPDQSLRGLAGNLLFDDGRLADALETVRARTGQTHFDLPLDLVVNRDATLERWLDELPPANATAPSASEDDDDDDDDDLDDEDDEEDAAEALRLFLESDAVASG